MSASSRTLTPVTCDSRELGSVAGVTEEVNF